MIFSIDLQRRVRLRNAKKFDLSPLLGEEVIVHVGELPQSQQSKLLESLELRRELLKRREAFDAATAGQVARIQFEVGDELAQKLFKAQQDLITVALLDARGDRMTVEDVRALFDLLPINPETYTLLQEMMVAIYERIGSKKPEAPAPGEAVVNAEALGK